MFYLVEFAFLVDLFLNFFQQYVDDHSYKTVTDFRLIAVRYINGKLFIDFIPLFPWSLIPNDEFAI
jgi:hypothetical protein